MKNEYNSTIDEFNQVEHSSKLILSSFKELKPNKSTLIGTILSIGFGALGAYLVGWAEETIELLSQTASILLNIKIALFGCIFAVYSIIISFLSDDMMKRLSAIPSSKDNAASILKKYTRYFESILFQFFIGICISGIVSLFCVWMPSNYRLTHSLIFDNTIATSLLFLYFYFSFRLIYEIKSMVYNTVQLYRYSIAFKFIAFVKDEKNDNKID